MSKKSYDEDEIINSMVDEKPTMTDEFIGKQRHRQANSNVHVNQVGCGCLNPRHFLIDFLVYIVVLMVTAGLFPGFYITDFGVAVRAAFLLSFFNVFVKPIVVFFTFPLTVLTLGLFYFIINGFILVTTAWFMGDGFVISDFLTAIFAALFISILQQLIKKYFLETNKRKR